MSKRTEMGNLLGGGCRSTAGGGSRKGEKFECTIPQMEKTLKKTKNGNLSLPNSNARCDQHQEKSYRPSRGTPPPALRMRAILSKLKAFGLPESTKSWTSLVSSSSSAAAAAALPIGRGGV